MCYASEIARLTLCPWKGISTSCKVMSEPLAPPFTLYTGQA